MSQDTNTVEDVAGEALEQATESGAGTAEANITNDPALAKAQATAAKEAGAETAKKAEAAARKLAIEAKVNGKIQKVDLDLDDTASIKKHIERSLKMDETFQSAAQQRKQIEQFITQLKNDPLSILKNPELGLNIKQLAEKVLMEELDEANKTPEQKEAEKLKKELEELRSESKKRDEEKRQLEMESLKQKSLQEFDDQITDALKGANVPKSPYVVKRIADALLEASQLKDDNGQLLYPDITVKQIMPFVEEQIQQEIQDMFGVMPTEVLEKLVGKQHLSKMKAARVAKAKEVVNAKSIKDTGVVKTEAKKEEKAYTPTALFGRF